MPKPVWSGRLAVLVNGATAGAGEGLAMILKRSSERADLRGGDLRARDRAEADRASRGRRAARARLHLGDSGGKRWNADGLVPDKVVKADGRRGEGDDDQLKKTLDDFGKTDAAEAAPKAA